MKADLTFDLIKRLPRDQKPVGKDSKDRLIFEPSLGQKDYIVWDSHPDAPAGFGARVSTRKTFIVRRKVRGVSVMAKVGNFTDFGSIGEARAAARKVARRIEETGKNPNAEARKASAAEITLGQAFKSYREHLATRTQRPASPATLRVIDRAIRKFVAFGWVALAEEAPAPANGSAEEKRKWSDERARRGPPIEPSKGRKVHDISTDDVMARFAEGKAHATANEQAFRWASAAAQWTIKLETLAAAAAKREPHIFANPFSILTLQRMYRSRDQLATEREENMARNPLGPTTTLGPFLEAAWSKRRTNNNETGIDYLILMILWGCRSSEHAPCVWGELLSEEERRSQSHVWLNDEGLNSPCVFFYKTKNGRNHRLPLGRLAMTILERRQQAAAEAAARSANGFGRKSRKYVFPSQNLSANSGHYKDATALLDSVREEAGIERLTRHDLRRSFGAVMASLNVPEGIQRRFLNHTSANVTDTYTQAEWALLKEWINKIEQSIISTAPNVYNSLRPSDWPPLPAPDPHVCKPAKPRPGRPRKA